MIQNEITIDAPAHIVREVFLNFPNLTKWHDQSFWISITILTPGKTNGMELVKGDKVKADLKGTSFNPIVEVNTPERFTWVGSIPLLFGGCHDFIFAPHPSGNANKTVFQQKEQFSGIIGYFGDYLMGEKTLMGWAQVNRDLKTEAERVYKAQRS